MQVRVVTDAPGSLRAGALVVPVFSDESAMEGATKTVDAQLNGAIADILAGGEIKGKLAELALVHAKDKPYKRVHIVG